MSTPDPKTTSPARMPSGRVVRWALATAGVVLVGIGAVGVFLPGLPTTVFLLGATWCFMRSCPWLEQRLVRNRFFGPFLGYLDRTEPMPLRAKLAAIASMWLFVTIAIVVLVAGATAPAWAPASLAGAACIGTVVIVRWDDRAKRSA